RVLHLPVHEPVAEGAAAVLGRVVRERVARVAELRDVREVVVHPLPGAGCEVPDAEEAAQRRAAGVEVAVERRRRRALERAADTPPAAATSRRGSGRAPSRTFRRTCWRRRNARDRGARRGPSGCTCRAPTCFPGCRYRRRSARRTTLRRPVCRYRRAK